MERNNAYSLGCATVLAVSAFLGYKAIRNIGLEPLTTDISEANFITNGMTGAQYEVVPDPEGKNRECVRIGEYSQENHRTLVGASVVVGPEKGVYIDTNGVIFNNGVIIGYFNRSVLPSYEAIPLANQDSIVCPEN